MKVNHKRIKLLLFAEAFLIFVILINTIEWGSDRSKITKASAAASLPAVSAEKRLMSRLPFSGNYTDVQGVLTFRGNHHRDNPVYGVADVKLKKITKSWQFATLSKGKWGGGAGWTGQPVLMHWDKAVKKHMNLYSSYKKKDFVEIIQGSLNGYVYFLDIKTGKQTRPPINTGNPIKGSVSLDARGYPLLYVGQGIPETNPFGFILYNLFNGKRVLTVKGIDKAAPRAWGAFDGSALFDRNNDTMYVGGENGLLYKIKLNTKYNKSKGTLKITPKITKRSSAPSNSFGIENSLAADNGKLFFSDNGGNMKCVDANLKTKWKYTLRDDTDSTIVLEKEKNKLVLYSGSEVDKQGASGTSRFVKLNASNGKRLWMRKFKCYNVTDLNGGMLSTPALGKKKVSKYVFITLCRTPNKSDGMIYALNKTTGKTVWSYKLPGFAWSSPVIIYDKSGKGYVFHIDMYGNVRLFDGNSGKVLSVLHIGSNVEASPAVYKNHIVVASRSGYINCFKIK